MPTKAKPPLPPFPPPPHLTGPHLALARAATGGLSGFALPIFGKNSRTPLSTAGSGAGLGAVIESTSGAGVEVRVGSGLSASHRPFAAALLPLSSEQQPSQQPQGTSLSLSQRLPPPSPPSPLHGLGSGSGIGPEPSSVHKRMSRSASTGELYGEHSGQGLGQGLSGSRLGLGSRSGLSTLSVHNRGTAKSDLHSVQISSTSCETSRILYIPELICAICHSVYDPSTAYGHHDVYLYPAREGGGGIGLPVMDDKWAFLRSRKMNSKCSVEMRIVGETTKSEPLFYPNSSFIPAFI